MSHQIIRSLRIPHCKRGPDRCEECRAAQEAAPCPCLLELHPPGEGMVQRPTIEVQGNDGVEWWAFDVVRRFDTAGEARSYAADHGIGDVILEE